MSDLISFPFKKLSFFGFAVMGFCFLSEVSFAQEDLGKIDSEILKPIDRTNQDNSINLMEGNTSNASLNQKHTILIPKTSPAVKKESPVLGEAKKTEPAPSTLNFNIFLYIVDKFKAD